MSTKEHKYRTATRKTHKRTIRERAETGQTSSPAGSMPCSVISKDGCDGMVRGLLDLWRAGAALLGRDCEPCCLLGMYTGVPQGVHARAVVLVARAVSSFFLAGN